MPPNVLPNAADLAVESKNASTTSDNSDEHSKLPAVQPVTARRFKLHGIVIDLEAEGVERLLCEAYEDLFNDTKLDEPTYRHPYLHEDPRLNLLEFNEVYPGPKYIGSHIQTKGLDPILVHWRKTHYRSYWFSLRKRGGFNLYWNLVQPRLPVGNARREELRQKALAEFHGQRGDLIYDAPRIAFHPPVVDPAIEDFHYETSLLMTDIIGAHRIQNESPVSFTHALSPILRQLRLVRPFKAEWPMIQGPIELYTEYHTKLFDSILKAADHHESASLVDPARDADWRLKDYRNCREVAGWWQVLELMGQGMVALWAAREDKILIFQGNTVDRKEFASTFPLLVD